MFSQVTYLFTDLSLDIPTKFTAKTAHPKNGEDVCDISGELVSHLGNLVCYLFV